jgi:hypothetical protein
MLVWAQALGKYYNAQVCYSASSCTLLCECTLVSVHVDAISSVGHVLTALSFTCLHSLYYSAEERTVLEVSTSFSVYSM